MIFEADGTHTTDAKPTRMAFYTTPSGSDTATERLRIHFQMDKQLLIKVLLIVQTNNTARFQAYSFRRLIVC